MRSESGSGTISELLAQGDALRLQGEWAKAGACYLQVTQMEPGNFPAWFGLGLISEGLQQYEQAVRCYEKALQINDRVGVLHFRLGWVMQHMQRFSDAIPHYRHAMPLLPSEWKPAHFAAICLHQLCRYDEALSFYRHALSLKQDDAALWYHTAKVLKDSGQLEPARSHYRRALELQPDYPQARFSLGLLDLLRGDWIAGWEGYEQRWQGWDRVGAERPPECDLPAWQGEAVPPDSGIIVFSEQGFGDSLQFFRYHTLLARHFERVCFCVPPALVRLFETRAPAYLTILPQDASYQAHRMTHHASMLSLPHHCRTTPQTVPDKLPYLHADPAQTAFWQKHLAQDSRRKIGIAWNGGRITHIPARDMDYSQLAPLQELADIHWICLQKENKPPAPLFASDWMDEMQDFLDTAALIASLDLVITVDTAVGHLAGGLGKPVWLLNRFESDWRWMRNRTDTPWYPATRIFNQPAPGDWQSVIGQVKNQLIHAA